MRKIKQIGRLYSEYLKGERSEEQFVKAVGWVLNGTYANF